MSVAELRKLLESRREDVWDAFLNADAAESLPLIWNTFTEHTITFYFSTASRLFWVRELLISEGAKRRIPHEFSNLEKLGLRPINYPINLMVRPPQYPSQQVDVSDWDLVKSARTSEELILCMSYAMIPTEHLSSVL